MPRPIWKGAITFGLVTVPVSMHPATERREELRFRLLHAKEASPVEYRRFCKEEEVEVPWNEIVKGYEHEKGQFVVMTDEDFEKARTPATQTIDIRDFVPRAQIDAVFFETPYVLEPSGKGAAKAYALLRDALAKADRLGVGTVVLRQREHLVALEPRDDVLVCTTMRYAHEIRSPRGLEVPKAGSGWDKREMDLALKLVETLAGDWEPEKYRDTYTEVLRRAIEQKVEGKEISVPPGRPAPRKVVDLREALEASLKTPRKELAKAQREGAAEKPRRGHGRRKRVA
jgi:DNA end-binding protein Ku